MSDIVLGSYVKITDKCTEENVVGKQGRVMSMHLIIEENGNEEIFYELISKDPKVVQLLFERKELEIDNG